MPSLIERLFPVRPSEPVVKAETGSGLFALIGVPPLTQMSTNQNKLMAEAELLFHSAVWVAAAERAIVGRLSSVPYHLEDEQGETITRDTSPLAASLIDALDHPSASPRRTRRQLWSITARHMGLAGNGFWYLDQRDSLAGTPLQTLYINPVRMTPAKDDGNNLIGWIMDHPDNPLTPRGISPVPFALEELIHFKLDEPDTGFWGVGVAETAQTKIELSRIVDRHATITVATGGRIAGIISPKQGGQPISDDGWAAVIRDYRNITGDPDSAKRVQVMRSPIDFTKTGSDVTELQLPQLGTMSRDDTLAAWGVPLSQLGIVPARGLNSGETPKYEEAQLWQGAIGNRADPMREKIQTEFIDRWAKLGLVATLVLESPSFDDLAPLYDNAVKAVNVPLTNDERRALVDLGPLEDKELGGQVYLAGTMTRVDEVAPPPVPIIGGPIPGAPPAATPDMPGEPTPAAPAKASPYETMRARIEKVWEPRLKRAVAEVLAAQREELASRIESKYVHLKSRPGDTTVWWNAEREQQRMRDALEPLLVAMAREVAFHADKRFTAQQG